MLRLYRQLNRGEFIVVGGDCSQGGIDSNWGQFISKDQVDVPLVLEMPGVAADMTPILHQTLEWVFDQTGVQPIVGLERNMGGSSEMERLRKLNRLNKYRIYYMKQPDGTSTDKPGFATDTSSRPRLVGDLKIAIDSMGLKIYDEETASQLSTFIVSKNGKPEGAPNTHDDAVMSLGVGWQLFQTENKVILDDDDDNAVSGDVQSLIVRRTW